MTRAQAVGLVIIVAGVPGRRHRRMDAMNFPRITETIAPPGPETSRLLDHRRAELRRLAEQLTDDIAAGIRVLATRDGIEITEEQIGERARNIAAGLIGNFRIEELP